MVLMIPRSKSGETFASLRISARRTSWYRDNVSQYPGEAHAASQKNARKRDENDAPESALWTLARTIKQKDWTDGDILEMYSVPFQHPTKATHSGWTSLIESLRTANAEIGRR
jgi:hypothetical protein